MRTSLHLASRLCGRRPARGVEVGVETGFNALMILQEWGELLGGSIAELVLVEIDGSREPEIRTRLRGHEPKYRLVLADSAEAARTFPDSIFDFVYIDDDHRYEGVRRSLEAWWPKVRWGGMLCGHDAELRQKDDDVLCAVRDFLQPFDQPWYVDGVDWWTLR